MVNELRQRADKPDTETTQELSRSIANELQSLNDEGKVLWLFVLATKYYAQLPESHEFDLTDYQMTAEQVMLTEEQE
jgi:hypothetical protein